MERYFYVSRHDIDIVLIAEDTKSNTKVEAYDVSYITAIDTNKAKTEDIVKWYINNRSINNNDGDMGTIDTMDITIDEWIKEEVELFPDTVIYEFTF